MGLTLNEAVEKMRGEIGSSIRITVIRGSQDPFDVTLKRAVIAVKSVRWELEDGNVGYVRISSFSEKTDSGLREAITKLKDASKNQLQGLVLDLRNNPGGLLDQAIAVSDAFIDKGEIVSTRGRKSEEAQRWNAESGDLDGRQADRDPDQRRLGLGLGDRGRRAAGPAPRRSCWAPSRSARARCRRSSRSRTTAPSA